MKTTFSRTFFPAVIVFVAALLLLGTSFQILVRDYLNDRAIESLENDATIIGSLASAYYAEDAVSSQNFLVNLSLAAQISEADAVICDINGRLILCSDSPMGCQHQGLLLDRTYLQQVLSTGKVVKTGNIDALYQDTRYVVGMPFHDNNDRAVGVIIVSTPMTQTLNILDRMSRIYQTVSIMVIAVSIILMTVLARRVTRPLREMAHAASEFGHGHLDARVNVHDKYPEDIKELAISFNNMASSLQKSEYQRQEFVTNVSHELKTPMTTISGYVDGMLDGTIPQEQHRQYMQIVSDETKRLSRLVRSMLDISRLQDQERIPEDRKSRFDLCECAGRVLITFEQKINAKKLNVQVDMPDFPVFTNAAQENITQVIYNLVDNAVKFCPEGGLLQLSIHPAGSKVYVTVTNSGDTIPPEELPLVFERFHKLDKSRSKNRDGWGLGLYIVRTIIGSHGEDISVSSYDGKTSFTFTLPFVN